MISVVIPVYKKTEMFVENLKHNLPFMRGCEVIVVNDDPEKSLKDILDNFPIFLVENTVNLGFAGAVNAGVKRAKNKYITLLNSDVILENDNFKSAVDHFKKNDKLFAVGFAQKEKKGTVVGKNKIFWKQGFLQHKGEKPEEGINAWAEGGASLFDKKSFDKLGGFDEVYSPFYWEDIDLSYRAWKMGYEVIFDSKIVVKHFHESTIGSYFTPTVVKQIAYRNQFLFVWKNITDFNLILSHILLLTPNLLKALVNGDSLFKGFLLALPKLPRALSARSKQSKLFKYSDREIISKFA